MGVQNSEVGTRLRAACGPRGGLQWQAARGPGRGGFRAFDGERRAAGVPNFRWLAARGLVGVPMASGARPGAGRVLKNPNFRWRAARAPGVPNFRWRAALWPRGASD
uniref:Uncharacterized protein n=1 Tax=Ananas comosus var. bracteatus TaxID=296719 RepID=A0A6V7PMG9_ANACO|nr:unnamed protein product [Ananas comosus var. bracteatus]